MQILITHGSLARTRVLRFNRWQLAAALFGLVVVLMLLSGTIYNLVFLKAAREGCVWCHAPTVLVTGDLEMQQAVTREGITCDFCHKTDNMAEDTPKKEKAREMMLMAQGINKTYFKGEMKVTCITCHNGNHEPKKP